MFNGLLPQTPQISQKRLGSRRNSVQLQPAVYRGVILTAKHATTQHFYDDNTFKSSFTTVLSRHPYLN